MNTDREQTSSLILDTIDNTPNLFFGFTSNELIICFMTTLILTSIPFCILSGYLFGTILFGFVMGLLVACVVSFFAGQKAEKLKKDRPSYMMWFDLRRQIQDKGILGVKINRGLVGDAVWEIQKVEKKGPKRKVK